MGKSIKLNILSPGRETITEEILSLSTAAVDGSIQILSNYAPSIIAIIPTIISCISLGTFIIDEIMVYFHSEDIITIEEKVKQEYLDGKEIKLLADLEHNDTIYKVYVPAEQSKNYVQAIGAHSIKEEANKQT